MMETIWQTLVNTPWWVYVLLGYLISIGMKASKTSTVSLPKLFIIPALFTVMSLHTLITEFPVNLFSLGTWLLAILLGTLVGWFQVYGYPLKVDKEKKLIQVPGTWSTMIIILIIFASKYYFGYKLAVDPAAAQQTWFEFCVLAVSGVCTGLFIGRLLCYVYRFRTSEHTSLSV